MRPATILFVAVVGTQIIATLTAVYGFLMAPIGWNLAECVRAYAFASFLVNDCLKLFAYRLLDHSKSTQQGILHL